MNLASKESTVLAGWDRMIEWVRGAYPEARVGETAEGLPRVAALEDPRKEMTALRQAVALIPTPDLAPILVEGADAPAYLHRRLAQSVRDLAVGSGTHALQLSGEGRLQADWLIYRGSEAFMVLAPAERADADATLIEKYTLNDDVTVDRFYAGEVMFAVAGPMAPALLGALIEPKGHAAQLRDEMYIGLFTVMLGGVPCRVFRDGRWNKATQGAIPFFYLCVPPMGLATLLRTLDEGAHAAGGGVCGADALRFIRLQSGPARWGEALGEGRIPLEAHLQDAIHFNKGCYPGQEFIARITNLGHPANSLARFAMEGEVEIAVGTEILDAAGETIGEVAASATVAGAGKTVGMAYLKWGTRDLKVAALRLGDEHVAVKLATMGGTHDEAT